MEGEEDQNCRDPNGEDIDRRQIVNSIEMITDDLSTLSSAMTTLFVAKRRSGRTITILHEALVGASVTNNFEALKTRRRRESDQSRSENLAETRMHSADYTIQSDEEEKRE